MADSMCQNEWPGVLYINYIFFLRPTLGYPVMVRPSYNIEQHVAVKAEQQATLVGGLVRQP